VEQGYFQKMKNGRKMEEKWKKNERKMKEK
jgi:hypothetical protein